MGTAPGSNAAVRDGPGGWRTSISVEIVGGAAGLCAESDGAQMTHLLDELSAAACGVADAVARTSGVDGMTVGPQFRRALQESVVIELISDELVRLGRGGVEDGVDGARQLVAAILAELERIATTTVEGASLAHGVVVRVDSPHRRSGHRYPADFRQKRVPLLFDGRDAVLVVDGAGFAVHEVQRARPERRLSASQVESVREFTERFGDIDGSLMAAVSRAFGSLGFYVHRDRSIWVCSRGTPMLVKRGVRWRAIPTEALGGGVGKLIGSLDLGRTVVDTTVLLALHGHGGIIAVVDSVDDVADCVPAKDRIADAPPASAEHAVHVVLDVDGLDTATLLRLAAIDGAIVVDTTGRLLAYGAVVSSSGSESEGARTAAARTLSDRARVVFKVSQDGPITVFVAGQQVGQLLA